MSDLHLKCALVRHMLGYERLGHNPIHIDDAARYLPVEDYRGVEVVKDARDDRNVPVVEADGEDMVHLKGRWEALKWLQHKCHRRGFQDPPEPDPDL